MMGFLPAHVRVNSAPRRVEFRPVLLNVVLASTLN